MSWAWMSRRRRRAGSGRQGADASTSHHCHGHQRALPPDAGAYCLCEALGAGTTSTVYAARLAGEQDPPSLAVKRIDLDSLGAELDVAIREVRLQARLRHAHLTPLLAAFSAGHELWLIQPRALCSVRDILEKGGGGRDRGSGRVQASAGCGLADHRAAAAIVHAVASALAYIHGEGAIHRDVKASNVLLFEEGGQVTARLADLGTATAADLRKSTAPGAGRADRALGASLWRAVSRRGAPSSRRVSWVGDGDGPAAPPPPPASAAPSPFGRPAPHGITSPFAGAEENGGGHGGDGPSSARAAAAADLPQYGTFVGSPGWMAPEVFDAAAALGGGSTATPATAPTSSYTQAADVFSLGCLICELAHGAPPGAGAPFPVLAMARLHGPAPELSRPDWPPEAAALVAACVARDPAARPSAAAVLHSPWLATAGEGDGGSALTSLVRAVLAPPAEDGEPAPAPPAPAAETTTGSGRRRIQRTKSDDALAPFQSRAGPPGREAGVAARLREFLARASVGAPQQQPAAGAGAAADAAAALDPPAAQAILRLALLPRRAAAGAGLDAPLSDALQTAVPPGMPCPDTVRALATATAVCLLGRDRAAGRGLGRFRYRLGAAFLRVPLPAATAGPAADTAYESCETCTAWAGPILFFLGRRPGGALPGVHLPPRTSHQSAATDAPAPAADSAPPEAPLALAVRTARGARELATLLTSTAAGGRRLADVLPPAPSRGQRTGPGGMSGAIWIYPRVGEGEAVPPADSPDAWPAMHGWSVVKYRDAHAAWAHACCDLTAAAFAAGTDGGGGFSGWLKGGRRPSSSSGGVSPVDILEGRVPPPRGWGGVIGDLVAARRFWEERNGGSGS